MQGAKVVLTAAQLFLAVGTLCFMTRDAEQAIGLHTKPAIVCVCCAKIGKRYGKENGTRLAPRN